MDNNKKKIIEEEWLKAFPELSTYAQNKLFKIIGAFVCGIELIKLPRVDSYRPHFVVYPLFRIGIEQCLRTPLIIDEFCDKKGNQISLPFNDIEKKYLNVQDIIKNSSKLNLNSQLFTEKDFFRLADYYLYDHNDVWYKKHSGKRASLFELKFYTALYVGNQDQIQDVLNQIINESKKWNMHMFKTWYGKFDLWIKELQEKVEKRDFILSEIEFNQQEKKILKLKSSELIA